MSNNKARSIYETKQRPSHGEAAAAVQQRAEEHHQQGHSSCPGRSTPPTCSSICHTDAATCDAICDSSRSDCTHWGRSAHSRRRTRIRRHLASDSPREGCHISAVEMHIPRFSFRAVTCQATAKRTRRCVSLHEQKEGAYHLHNQQVRKAKKRGGEGGIFAPRLECFMSKVRVWMGVLCGDRHARVRKASRIPQAFLPHWAFSTG
jgi:hypothetical protein